MEVIKLKKKVVTGWLCRDETDDGLITIFKRSSKLTDEGLWENGDDPLLECDAKTFRKKYPTSSIKQLPRKGTKMRVKIEVEV